MADGDSRSGSTEVWSGVFDSAEDMGEIQVSRKTEVIRVQVGARYEGTGSGLGVRGRAEGDRHAVDLDVFAQAAKDVLDGLETHTVGDGDHLAVGLAVGVAGLQEQLVQGDENATAVEPITTLHFDAVDLSTQL